LRRDTFTLNFNFEKTLFFFRYFAYLGAGIVPKTGEVQQVRWAEMYEDGQGMGQNTAACAPVYDKSVTPPDLFGVVCNSILKGDLDALSGWPAEWVKMKTDNAKCPNLVLSEVELEQIRTTIGNDASCVETSAGAIIGGIIGGVIVLGLLFVICKSCAKPKPKGVNGHGGGAVAREVAREQGGGVRAVPVAIAHADPGYNPHAGAVAVPVARPIGNFQ
jgi:hypothetical protein